MTKENIDERMAELEREGFQFRRRTLADQALEGLGLTNAAGDKYRPGDILPQEVVLVLVYDKSESVYLVCTKP